MSPAPAPDPLPPVSTQEYEAELRAVGEALSTALSGIAAAVPFEPLADALTSSAAQARASARRLQAIAPPGQPGLAPATLIPALNRFASGLSGLGAQVRSRDLCAAPSVMATISTLPGTVALRDAIGQLGPAGAGLGSALPGPTPLPDRRLENGSVLRDPGSGYGEIEVQNGTDHDAVVTLSRGGEALGSFYVARGETALMDGVLDGSYDIFFTSGADWDGTAFTQSCAFNRFDGDAIFETDEVENGIEYTRFSVTLHAVPAGSAEIVSVPPESFPM